MSKTLRHAVRLAAIRPILLQSMMMSFLLASCMSNTAPISNKEISQVAEVYGDYLLAISSDSAKTQSNQSYLNAILDQHRMTNEQFVKKLEAIQKDATALKKMLELVNARLEKSMPSRSAPTSSADVETMRRQVPSPVPQPRRAP